MKFLIKKGFWNKLIIVLLLIIAFNAIIPTNVVHAESDVGGVLLRPIVDLVLAIADAIINVIHKVIFDMSTALIVIDLDSSVLKWIVTIVVVVIVAVAMFALLYFGAAVLVPAVVAKIAGIAGVAGASGLAKLGAAAIGTIIVTSIPVAGKTGLAAGMWVNRDCFGDQAVFPLYAISPEEIFAGEIPMLNVNFFKEESTSTKNTSDQSGWTWLQAGNLEGGMLDYWSRITSFLEGYGYNSNGTNKAYPDGETIEEWTDSSNTKYKATIKITMVDGGVTEYKVTVYKFANPQQELEDMSIQLKPTVAKWYYALRNVAIVGMMVILLYIGIRVMLCSVASEKAKYKNMLWDWIVALCLIFVMHYIMVFANNITDSIIKVFNTVGDNNVQLAIYEDDDGKLKKKLKKESDSEDGIYINEDIFFTTEDGIDCIAWQTNSMGKARILAAQNDSNSILYVGYAVAFLVLAFYTVIFLVTYLKRLVYMAFLTIIAPLVAMTYPLDKLHDGKAQAFDMWLKEYIFNLLLQPVHLLLYTVLIASAFELEATNIIYTLVAIGFMIPAEKLVRKFFGFEKAQTPGMLGGAAGAALLMGGLNKILKPHHHKQERFANGSEKDDNEFVGSAAGATDNDLMIGDIGEPSGKNTLTTDEEPRSVNMQSQPRTQQTSTFTNNEPKSSIWLPDSEKQRQAVEEAKAAAIAKKAAEEEAARKAAAKKAAEESAAAQKAAARKAAEEYKKKHPIKSFINPKAKIARDYAGKRLSRAMKNYRGRGIQSIGRFAGGAITGSAAAILGGAIGIASGDLGKTGQYTATAVAAGYAVGSRKTPTIADRDAKEIGRDIDRSKYDTIQEYKEAQLKQKREENTHDIDNIERLQEYLNIDEYEEAQQKLEDFGDCFDAGINDIGDIASIIKLVESGWDKKLAKTAAKAYKNAGKRPSKMGGDEYDNIRKRWERYVNSNGITDPAQSKQAVDNIIQNIEIFGKTKDGLTDV